MPRLDVWPETQVMTAGARTLSARLQSGDGSTRRLWYRFPESAVPTLPETADHYLVAALLLAMSQPADLWVHGVVSRSLMRNLEEFQAAWAAWRPGVYHHVELRADAEYESLPADSLAAVTMFSGGVDSCWSALRHARHLAGRQTRPLAAGLMLHGFDIPLSKPVMFAQAAERSRAMLASLDLELLIVVTNYREIMPLPWEDAFAPGLASCLHLFQRNFSIGLIPASFSYHSLVFPYGSNPITDPLLGSDSFRIFHDGAELSRAGKIARLAHWPEGLQGLRVCWEGMDKSRNCGRCEKCVRTLLNFRVSGITKPPCFDRTPSDAEIRRLRVKDAQLQAMRNLLGSATRRGIRDPWVAAVRDCIRGSERLVRLRAFLPQSLHGPIKRLVRRLRPRTAA